MAVGSIVTQINPSIFMNLMYRSMDIQPMEPHPI